MKKNSLETYVLEKIGSGEWEEGYKLPSEIELINKFNFSKSTVRKTIQKLVNKEILFSIQGKGVFVSRFYRSNKEISLKNELESDKIIYLPTNYQIPKDVYSNSPFNLGELTSENSFQFIKIYFSNKDVQAYSINWIINNNDKYSEEEKNDLINGKTTLFEQKVFEKVYHKHFFQKPINFDNKLLRVNLEFIPTSYAYFLDEKNKIVMIRIYKTKPKYFQKEQIKIIK